MPTMHEEKPPAALRQEIFERAVCASPSAVGLLRDLTETHLLKWGLAGCVDGTLLVVSELATNAVRAKPGHLVGFRLMKWPTMLVVEVYDESPGDARPAPPDGGEPSIGGRGLHIVEALALHWGQRRELAGGKTVYALLPIS